MSAWMFGFTGFALACAAIQKAGKLEKRVDDLVATCDELKKMLSAAGIVSKEEAGVQKTVSCPKCGKILQHGTPSCIYCGVASTQSP